MSRQLAMVFPALCFFVASLAYAVEEEQPIETSTTGIVVFLVALVVCIGVFGWYMYRNEKKPDDEKLGEKF